MPKPIRSKIQPAQPLILASCLALLASIGQAYAATLAVDGLKCEYRANPLGLDTPPPRLSWQLESKARGQRQACQAFALHLGLVPPEEKPIERVRGVQFLRWGLAHAVLAIGSGQYNFASTLE